MRSKFSRSDRGLTVTRAVLLIAAVSLIGVLAYRQIIRLVGSAPEASVWVSAVTLPAGQPVTVAQLRLVKTIPPNGTLVNRSDIEGRTLMAAKAAGQPFYVRDLAPRPPAAPLSGTVPAGRLLATIRVDAMDLPVSELRAGDRLDIMQAELDGVRLIAHDAYVMGVLEKKSPQTTKGDSGMLMGVDISIPGSRSSATGGSSLVLALFPQDVFPMAAAEGSGRPMKIVLHSAGEVRSGTLLTVLPQALPKPSSQAALRGSSVEFLAGARRETLHFNGSSRASEPVPPRAVAVIATLR